MPFLIKLEVCSLSQACSSLERLSWDDCREAGSHIRNIHDRQLPNKQKSFLNMLRVREWIVLAQRVPVFRGLRSGPLFASCCSCRCGLVAGWSQILWPLAAAIQRVSNVRVYGRFALHAWRMVEAHVSSVRVYGRSAWQLWGFVAACVWRVIEGWGFALGTLSSARGRLFVQEQGLFMCSEGRAYTQ